MVANDQPRADRVDEEMTPIRADDVTHAKAVSSDIACPHCNFRCNSTALMTQHSWEQHPLLMRRKKHLITSSKVDSTDERMRNSKATTAKSPPPVIQTAQKMQNCSLSGSAISPTDAELFRKTEDEQKHMIYREKAMRSLSMLSTAAAILENQSNQAPERHLAVVKPDPIEQEQPVQPYPREDNQPMFASVYRAYIPALNQYVTLPIAMATMNAIPNGSVSTAALGNSMTFLDSQQPCISASTQYNCPIPPSYSYYPPNPQQVLPKASQNQPTDEIRNLLKSHNQPAQQRGPTTVPAKMTKCPKGEKKSQKQAVETSAKTFPACLLDKERQKRLEQALLSTDYCDINDSSMTMPFKCSDGVWKMVKFKCIKGLWVVQTPDSPTPTVYVPCNDEEHKEKPARKAGRSLSDTIGHKRKLSDDLESDIDAKRLCASAPMPNTEGNIQPMPSSSLKRTLSNPFITTSLPPPSKQFTNNEGKRVNISMIKRNSSRNSASCDLLKTLLLRKSSPQYVNSSQQSSSSSTSSSFDTRSSTGSSTEKSTPDLHLAATLTKTLLKTSMAF